jgi:Abnormal spindle-like microcephaly-assoc'd, ASPM-SPD-2-Hydin
LILNAGQTASLTLGFTSQNGGPFTGVLTIASNSSAGNLVINMSAAEVGVLTSVTCSSSSMSGAGVDSCAANLNGQAPAGGYAIALTSNNSTVTVPSGVTVAAGATSAPFNATVAATTSSQTATITASAGGTSKSFSLALAPPGVGNLAANAGSLSFGTVMVGQPATQSLILTASGGSVQINSAGVTGTGFSVSGLTFPAMVPSGQSVTLSVEFAPTSSGSISGQLTIQSNAASGTIALPLSATGDVYKVQLNWDAPSSSSDPVAGYYVYRATNGSSTYQQLNASPTTETSYLDSTIADGQSYMYYVVSVDSAGEQSTPSNTATLAIP